MNTDTTKPATDKPDGDDPNAPGGGDGKGQSPAPSPAPYPGQTQPTKSA